MVIHFLKSSYEKLKSALKKTRAHLGDRLRTLFGGKLDAQTLDELEEMLFQADLGARTAHELTQMIQSAYQKNPQLSSDEMIALMREELITRIGKFSPALTPFPNNSPLVILIVGVNGNGKTTTIAKLAHQFIKNGKKVLLGAGDTFRAGAIDQLIHWADVVKADIVKGKPHCDPAAIAFDATQAALSRGIDAVLIDTAGRLHTKTPLMHELSKIKRSCDKVIPGAPHETLLILDATTGQNAIDQAKTFQQYTPLTGLILTKLDGTAKGGVIVNIQRELNLPVKFIGIGEGLEDLEPFDPEAFVNSIFS